MTIEEAISELQNRLPRYHPCDKIFRATELAIAALRAQQERDDPKPLTLDELRELGGEPVWCAGKSRFGVAFEAWKVISKYNSTERVIRFTDGDDRLPESYGKTWLAYRTRPKEAQK